MIQKKHVFLSLSTRLLLCFPLKQVGRQALGPAVTGRGWLGAAFPSGLPMPLFAEGPLEVLYVTSFYCPKHCFRSVKTISELIPNACTWPSDPNNISFSEPEARLNLCFAFQRILHPSLLNSLLPRTILMN